MRYLPRYNEAQAQEHFTVSREACIIYCMKVVPMFLAKRSQFSYLITPSNKNDWYQDLYLVVIEALDTYKRYQGSTIFNWLFIHMDYHCFKVASQRRERVECQYDDTFDVEAPPERSWEPLTERYCPVCKKVKLKTQFKQRHSTCIKCQKQSKQN